MSIKPNFTSIALLVVGALVVAFAAAAAVVSVESPATASPSASRTAVVATGTGVLGDSFTASGGGGNY